MKNSSEIFDIYIYTIKIILILSRWDPSLRLNAEEAMKHPWILELKKKNSKDVRPKHRLRREAETSVEHDNNR
jgi:hypothetical protein